MKVLYLTPFLVFFNIGRNNWNTDSNVAKGVAGVAFVQIALIGGAVLWIRRLSGAEMIVDIPKVGYYLSALVLIFANYYVLVVQGHGIRYQREFHNFQSRKKVFLMLSGIAITGIGFVFLVVSAIFARHVALH